MDDLEKIQAQIAQLQKQAEELAHQKKAQVLADVKAKIRAYGITLKDLGLSGKGSSQAGVPVQPKYRQGDLTWSGRGRQPKFIEDYIATGGKLEDLLIK